MVATLTSFGTGEFSVRWKEPFLTEGLNRKDFTKTPGIYRGFRLATAGAGNRIVSVNPSVQGDHVAVYQTLSGYSIAIRKTGGAFPVDLSAYAAGQVVYVCLWAAYGIGATTVAEVRAYTDGELAVAPEAPELVILGKVNVVVGVLPAANVTETQRTSANVQQMSEEEIWRNVVVNGNFSIGYQSDYADGALLAWSSADFGNDPSKFVEFFCSPGAGPFSNGLLNVRWRTAGSDTITLTQYLSVASAPSKRLRLKAQYKILALPSGGSYTATLKVGYEAAGGGGSGTLDVVLPVSATTASWVSVDAVLALPAGKTTVTSVSLVIVANVLSFAVAPTTFVQLTSVSLMVEPSEIGVPPRDVPGILEARRLRLHGVPTPRGFDHEFYPIGTTLPGPTLTSITATLLRRCDYATSGSAGCSAEQPLLIVDGGIFLGYSLTGLDLAAEYPRIQIRTGLGFDYTALMQPWRYGWTQLQCRLFLHTDSTLPDANGALVAVAGAKWDQVGTQWVPDFTSGNTRASRVEFTRPANVAADKDVFIEMKWADPVADFADGAWNDGWRLGVRSNAAFTADYGYLYLSAPLGSDDIPEANTLYSDSGVKMYYRGLLNGGGITTGTNFNVAGVVVTGALIKNIEITYRRAFDFPPVVTADCDDPAYYVKAFSATVSSVSLWIYDYATNTRQDPTAITPTIYVTCFGRLAP